MSIAKIERGEVDKCVRNAFEWLARTVWRVTDKELFAWPYYEKDPPNAHSTSQILTALRMWGEPADSPVIKGIVRFIDAAKDTEKDTYFWRNPGRALCPCTYTTALCIRALDQVGEPKEIIDGGFKWLSEH